jgi:RHS repeat-associated protein
VEYGIVGYTHAGGVDRPLVAYKTMGGNAGAVVVPHMNWRGLFSLGTNSSGGASTTPVEWPGFRTTAYHSKGETQSTTKNWMGSLLEGQRDAGGLMYMRNRYYDPATGQFTQTDPIGIAGGLNTYGFAGGDPVSYSDPYGLCKVQVEYTNFPGIFGVFFNHTLVTTTDEKGSTFFRGGPRDSGKGSSSGSSESSESSDKSSGGGGSADSAENSPSDLFVESGPNDAENNPDWQVNAALNPPPFVVVDNNEACDRYNQSFSSTMNAINAAHIRYRARSTNSNAVTAELLRRYGLPVPAESIDNAPGWGVRLRY